MVMVATGAAAAPGGERWHKQVRAKRLDFAKLLVQGIGKRNDGAGELLW
jgi:hypothetical protein